ncbi:MAG: TIGR04282 family arsenosugar biosynthesis glycosyltransferase [Gemmataceae bacterium]|nr:TIGR04282 family arsenosugar biosynthesis glycosyltransferase [Gemmataceae bacterium]MDW8267211.1 TIGR04282 family arsenosugar biosynthesis glycosyltransferase [Gemmataceae bacterium]
MAEGCGAERVEVLGVLAKWPQPGRVKTRLAAGTSPEWAAAVAAALLRDSLERWSAVSARRVLVYAPRESQAAFAELAAGRFALVPQVEGDLGERMAAFFRDQFAAGARAVILLGTDSPTLPVDLVRDSFALLRKADVVLGPATDGGYYLVGCRRMPPIFEGVTWGSSDVLRQTVTRLGPDWRLAVLPPWYDVDTWDDWRLLRGHVAALRRAGIEPGLRHLDQVGEPPCWPCS